jgi:hypothetical protein
MPVQSRNFKFSVYSRDIRHHNAPARAIPMKSESTDALTRRLYRQDTA